ncbi:MAG: hypothetical protein ABI977_14670 [Acidobacteriota bacterium]
MNLQGWSRLTLLPRQLARIITMALPTVKTWPVQYGHIARLWFMIRPLHHLAVQAGYNSSLKAEK